MSRTDDVERRAALRELARRKAASGRLQAKWAAAYHRGEVTAEGSLQGLLEDLHAFDEGEQPDPLADAKREALRLGYADRRRLYWWLRESLDPEDLI